MSFNYDTWGNKLYGLPYGLYFYYLNPSLFTGSFQGVTYDNTAVIGNSGAIQSLLYTPFISSNDLDYFMSPYDTVRFGSTDGLRPSIKNSADVYRITAHKNTVKILGYFSPYETSGNSIGGNKNWRNESKLLQYPYHQILITDHINTPLEIKPHLCRSGGKVCVRTSLSAKCTYNIYVEGYKNDTNGALEGSVSSGSLDLPVSSSAYSNFISSSNAQFMTANILNMGSSALSIASGQPSLMLTGLMQGADTIGQMMSKKTDLNNTPRAVKTMGGDVPFSLLNGEKKVEVVKYRISDKYLNLLSDYFDMYGYKQNKIMKPNLKSRYYHNYIKTVNANVSGNIDYEDKKELEEIYNKGVIIYHFFNNTLNMNHNVDNFEV